MGRGEAAPSLRYNESTERILSVLKQKVKLPDDCSNRDIIWNYILPQLKGINALEAAFSMAFSDVVVIGNSVRFKFKKIG